MLLNIKQTLGQYFSDFNIQINHGLFLHNFDIHLQAIAK